MIIIPSGQFKWFFPRILEEIGTEGDNSNSPLLSCWLGRGGGDITFRRLNWTPFSVWGQFYYQGSNFKCFCSIRRHCFNVGKNWELQICVSESWEVLSYKFLPKHRKEHNWTEPEPERKYSLIFVKVFGLPVPLHYLRACLTLSPLQMKWQCLYLRTSPAGDFPCKD